MEIEDEQEIGIREKLAGNNKTGDKVTNMMQNRIPVEGEPERAPKAGDVIQYLDTEGEWRKVTVTNRNQHRSILRTKKEIGQESTWPQGHGNITSWQQNACMKAVSHLFHKTDGEKQNVWKPRRMKYRCGRNLRWLVLWKIPGRSQGY